MRTLRYLIANGTVEVVITEDDDYGCFGYYHNTIKGTINQIIGKGMSSEYVLESIKEQFNDN